MIAAGAGHAQLVTMLAQRFKAKIDAKDKQRKTAYDLADANGHQTVLDKLVGWGWGIIF